MRAITIEGTSRKEMGTTAAQQLRREEMVPCVIYGTGENIHFQTEEKSFKEILYTPEALLVVVNVDGKEHKCVVREAQFHPVTERLLHVDLYEFVEGKPITIQVPIKLVGNPRGVRNGGRLKVTLRKLTVKASLENMPGMIELDIEKLRIGDALRLQDVPADGFEIIGLPTRTILTIQTSRNAVLDADEEDEDGEGEGEATEASAESEA
jgi:large subunit ribosomal protein L25